MKVRFFYIAFLAVFVGLCVGLVIESALFGPGPGDEQGALRLLASTTGADFAANTKPAAQMSIAAKDKDRANELTDAFDLTTISAYPAVPKNVTLGSIDPDSGFKFYMELTSRGAAIGRVILSEHDDRDHKNPQPLVLLAPVVEADGQEILSMANAGFDLSAGQKFLLRLQDLHWESSYVIRQTDGAEKVVFQAIIKDAADRDTVKLTKTYTVMRDSYHLDCELTIENLSSAELKPRFGLQGPVGIGREDIRWDMRKVIGGFINSEGQISAAKLDAKKLRKATQLSDRRLVHKDASARFIWAAVVNKYFAAILRPIPDKDRSRAGWVTDKTGRSYDPDNQPDSNDETVGLGLSIGSIKLAAAGEPESSKTIGFQLYLGPKDRSFFQKNELYRRLGFLHTIDFRTCCCPASIVNPLAFGILALMKWMHGFWPHNYGIVIIILVLLIRLLLHPITKKSQVSMMKYSKLAPKVAEIRKQFANNQAEAHKRILAYYKEQGVSPVPIMGMLPMMVQMPLWIALWSAINASIDLRGAGFLPVWITDLSVPDALVRFATITVPLLGWKITSLNLLPILMGVAFYLQQKLMPHQSPDAAASPQAAQQQKMMMIMLPVMFPLMLYNGPSGVNLYIMASVFAGVFEQYVIRKHIRQKETQEEQVLVSATAKTGGKARKKKPKPFFKY